MAEKGKIQTSFMELGYMTFGKKGAQPFVLLPGLSLKSVLGMAEFVEREYRIIGENYECFLFEPGMSVPEDITIEAMAECTKEAMDELGIKDFVLMGVSMGGMIAQELTLRHPEMVSKLILCSTADHIPESSRELINKWIGFAENRDGIGLCNAFAEHVYTKEYAEKYSAAFEMLGKGMTEAEFERFQTLAGCVKSLGTTNRLEQISCPVFVIAGREDRIFSAETQKCLAEKTRGEYCLYEHYAHAVYDEAPDIKEKILNWCMEH